MKLTKNDLVVEVKPGEEAVSVNVAATVEKFVAEEKEEVKKPVKAIVPGKKEMNE